uniref:Proline-rich receptor-like protein kinase PERK2 n=1 Tax=Petromyzon marinus TaxID=7757 RepID=A0AAJ7UFG4_PETMA|nr:proline-rich receptor-like protein kinase PERK2 [Petromyzon marinus]
MSAPVPWKLEPPQPPPQSAKPTPTPTPPPPPPSTTAPLCLDPVPPPIETLPSELPPGAGGRGPWQPRAGRRGSEETFERRPPPLGPRHSLPPPPMTTPPPPPPRPPSLTRDVGGVGARAPAGNVGAGAGDVKKHQQQQQVKGEELSLTGLVINVKRGSDTVPVVACSGG